MVAFCSPFVTSTSGVMCAFACEIEAVMKCENHWYFFPYDIAEEFWKIEIAYM